ncbi:MAG: T9SS type A sorting domain-containing protein [Flavobacteriales bacterium]|nr:T9SS type A sorting domain-containing protein [Flavobacteriales bacterium]
MNTGLAGAQSGNKYLQFSITANTGWQVSLSTLDANFRRSSTGPNAFQWQYSLDGFATAGVNAGAEISYTGTATNGDAQAQIDLSAIAALQNVAAGTTITFRLFGWGASATGGTFAIGRLAGNDLAIGGTVEPGVGPMCGIFLGAANAACNSQTAGPGNDTYDLSIPYTGIDALVSVINNSGSGTVGGDDPALVSDGTIVISGINEDDAYNITFSSPCDALTVNGAAPSCEPPFAGTTISFDEALLWTAGSGSLASYFSDHVYEEADWSFTGGPALRNGTAAQDGFAGALGTYAWRLQNVAGVDWRATYEGGDILENFGFSVRRWDDSPSPAFEVSYSTNGGSTFSAAVAVINNAYLNNSSDWKVFSHIIASPSFVPAGQFVVRVISTGTTERIMVDDFTFETSPAPPCPFALENLPNFDENTCACELGFYATIEDIDGNDVITDCTICPPGSFCPDGLSAAPCPAGTFSDSVGAINCAPCAAGYANNNMGQTACTACPPGAFSASAGAEECDLCPANTYNPVSAQTECLACPDGETSGLGATACTPSGGPCTADLFFVHNNTTNYQDLVWTIHDQNTDAVVETGGINPGEGSVPLCLPDGCYYLRVTNSGGNTITGGYRLILKNAVGAYNNDRIIDDTDNLVLGPGGDSGISGNEGFCIPLGTDEPIYTSCDRYWWKSGDYLVGSENLTVSAEFGGPNAGNSGYEFWFYDPNGGLSFRKTRVHTVSDGFAPNNAVRACHIKLNNWAAASHLQNGVLYNVRSRGVVAGNPLSEFGPACRVTLDPVLAACPPTGLNDIPGNPNFSCGVNKKFGGPNQVANRLFARPVAGANLYEWEFTNDPNEPAYYVTRQTTGVQRHLNWPASQGDPMLVGNTYRVRVRASKNNGVTWCDWGWTCEVTIIPSAAPGNENMALEGDAASNLALWPNPNNGQQVWITLDELAAEVGTVAVDLYDLSGKRVMAREIATQGGQLYTNIDLGGLAAGTYLVTITAGDEQHMRRLVVQP